MPNERSADRLPLGELLAALSDRLRGTVAPTSDQRDVFAAFAMLGEILTSCSDATPEAARALVEECHRHNQTPAYRIALHAYKFADAMMDVREARR